MPRYSANPSFLFTEVPFLERFGEAARADFRAVEFGFAYNVPAPEIAARLAEHRLACVLINAPPGDWSAGERGIAALPGREHEFAGSFATALRYAQTLDCPRIHVPSGIVSADAAGAQRSHQRSVLVRNLDLACAQRGGRASRC